jgi:hypothetical protein
MREQLARRQQFLVRNLVAPVAIREREELHELAIVLTALLEPRNLDDFARSERGAGDDGDR